MQRKQKELMEKSNITRATLGRLPIYLDYIYENVKTDTVSAAAIARGLSLGEVQVRKDLSMISNAGRPKTGYPTDLLLHALEEVLGVQHLTPAVLVGAGKLGRAIYDFEGFSTFGIKIVGAFDQRVKSDSVELVEEKSIYPMEMLMDFCRSQQIRVGILTVPAAAAQTVCNLMVRSGVTAIWNFAACRLSVPKNVIVRNENLALSLAHLVSDRKLKDTNESHLKGVAEKR